MLTTLNIVSLDQGKGLAWKDRPSREAGHAAAEAAGATARSPDGRRRVLAGLASLAVLVLPLTTRRRRG